jgi:hypothetical protein
MISLKSFAPVLAPTFGVTPAAVYERQRSLVRQGLLPKPELGRGNGLAATPDTVALMVIAFMVTDNLSDTDDRVRRVAELPAVYEDEHLRRRSHRCNLTGKRDFKSALAAMLKVTRFPPRVRVTVSRDTFSSKIFYTDDFSSALRSPEAQRFPLLQFEKLERVSEFGAAPDRNYVVEANLRSGALETIAKALRTDSAEDLQHTAV